jgi:3'-5' exoribonuclease
MDPRSLEVGELISEVFLVAEAKLQVDRRGQNYYSLTLNYEGGRRLDGKVWADNIGAKIAPGQGIEVLARLDQYLGDLQLNIQRYKILSPEEFDVSRFVRVTEIDTDEAFETLFNWERDEFKDPHFKKLMGAFYANEAFAQEFKTSPAASFHHHNYRGGLIEHTLDMWTLAGKLFEHYGGRFDRELLLCGVAVHDVGKVKCYTLATAVSEHTDVGNLLNHIFISASMVSNLWDSVVAKDDEKAAQKKALLLHIILSHHGKREWGSPVLPQTSEAMLIHYCDQISATMRSCFDAIQQRPEGESWTDKLYIMDDPRRLFVPPV